MGSDKAAPVDRADRFRPAGLAADAMPGIDRIMPGGSHGKRGRVRILPKKGCRAARYLASIGSPAIEIGAAIAEPNPACHAAQRRGFDNQGYRHVGSECEHLPRCRRQVRRKRPKRVIARFATDRTRRHHGCWLAARRSGEGHQRESGDQTIIGSKHCRLRRLPGGRASSPLPSQIEVCDRTRSP
jgi:hypothetical protein